MRLRYGIIFFLFAIAVPADARAQSGGAQAGRLFDELARMDSLLFDASFVSCDAEVANAIFTEDVEFYHDQTGFQNSEQTRENTRRLTASCPADRGITRSVVEGSMRVYPMADFGAIQEGIQRFDERGVSTSTVARFVHLWKKVDGEWRLARVLSYDHRTE